MASGATGSLEAIDQALRALAEFLMTVLQDDANMSSLESTAVDGNTRSKTIEATSMQSFMDELRSLSVKAQGQSSSEAEGPSGQVEEMVFPKSVTNEQRADSSKGIGSLHVIRTKDWVEKTSIHVDKLLSATFPDVKQSILSI